MKEELRGAEGVSGCLFSAVIQQKGTEGQQPNSQTSVLSAKAIRGSELPQLESMTNQSGSG